MRKVKGWRLIQSSNMAIGSGHQPFPDFMIGLVICFEITLRVDEIYEGTQLLVARGIACDPDRQPRLCPE